MCVCVCVSCACVRLCAYASVLNQRAVAFSSESDPACIDDGADDDDGGAHGQYACASSVCVRTCERPCACMRAIGSTFSNSNDGCSICYLRPAHGECTALQCDGMSECWCAARLAVLLKLASISAAANRLIPSQPKHGRPALMAHMRAHRILFMHAWVRARSETAPLRDRCKPTTRFQRFCEMDMAGGCWLFDFHRYRCAIAHGVGGFIMREKM